MTSPRTTPVAVSDRLETLDLLRGVALCGILLMNVVFMGGYRQHPPLPAVLGSPDWAVWFVTSVGLEGTMRGLFTLLFGAGVIMMTRREGADAADVYMRRCLMLVALGVVNVVVLVFPGDILFFYGLAGLLLFTFRNLRPRTMLVIAGVLVLALTARNVAEVRPLAAEMHQGRLMAEARAAGTTLTPDETKKAETWTAAVARLYPDTPEAAKKRKPRASSWPAAVQWSWTWWTNGLKGYFLDILVECIAFILVGMALFKLGVTGGGRSWKLYALMAAGGYAVGLPLNLWEAVTAWNTGFRPDVWIIWPTYQIDRLAMTIGHLGALLLLWKAGALAWPAAALRAIGRLGLTNYLGQSLIGALVFYGLGLWSKLSLTQLWGFCIVVWAVQATFSLLYLKRFAIGPAEWLLRSVAYGRRQPVRIRAAEPEPASTTAA